MLTGVKTSTRSVNRAGRIQYPLIVGTLTTRKSWTEWELQLENIYGVRLAHLNEFSRVNRIPHYSNDAGNWQPRRTLPNRLSRRSIDMDMIRIQSKTNSQKTKWWPPEEPTSSNTQQIRIDGHERIRICSILINLLDKYYTHSSVQSGSEARRRSIENRDG